MYSMNVKMHAPGTDWKGLEYPLELADKKALHKVEKAFVKALDTLIKLTEDELKSGKKPFAKTNPATVFFEVNISKEGADYGGYTHRWPNQGDEARAFLKSLLEGLMDGTGFGKAKKDARA